MNTMTILATVALSLIVLMILFNVLIVPRIRKSTEAKQEIRLSETIAKFKKGDKVLLASGIRAIFVKRKNDVLYVEISKNVIIKIDRHAVIGVYK